jgi:hypothetical protein
VKRVHDVSLVKAVMLLFAASKREFQVPNQTAAGTGTGAATNSELKAYREKIEEVLLKTFSAIQLPLVLLVFPGNKINPVPVP